MHFVLQSICTVDEIKKKLIEHIESDKNLSVFNSLNNGDIRTQFGNY